MRLKKFVLSLSLALAASFAGAQDLPKEINIAYVKSPFNLQNIVMKEQKSLEKEFEKDGIKVNWLDIHSGKQQAMALASRSVDMTAVMNTSSLLMHNAAGIPLRVATGVSHPTEIFALVGKPGAALTVTDLKGKSVAGPKGTILHQLLLAALEKEGLKKNDVRLQSMPPQSALAALLSGKVDAALIAAGGIKKAEENGCKVIATAKGLVDVNLVVAVHKDFSDQYPQIVDRVVSVHRKTLDWILNNWEKAVDIGAKVHNIDHEMADRLAKASHLYNKLTEADIEGMNKDQKFLTENGIMKNPINVRDIILPSALR